MPSTDRADELLALADFWDAEPTCTCTSTDRGTDTLGCLLHDASEDR